MIKHFRVQNYKALRDVSLDLTPIHVLIGPNDSGKTSVLEAVEALCRSVDYPLSQAFTGLWSGRSLVWHAAEEPLVSLQASGNGRADWRFELKCRFSLEGPKVTVEYEYPSVMDFEMDERDRAPGTTQTFVYSASVDPTLRNQVFFETAAAVRAEISGAQRYRWIPQMLSLPVALDASRRFRMEPSGFGLAACLDDILGYDRARFTSLEREIQRYFPHIESLVLKSEPAYRLGKDGSDGIPLLGPGDGKGLYVQFRNGPLVRASQVSDGVLLILAYLAAIHVPEPPRVLLIEEPENGIHPARLRELLGMLRTLIGEQNRTQIVLTTHSPYVVDLFQPEEVTLTRMQADGSVAVRRLVDSDLVRKQADFFTLGEIWTAEGDEALARPAAVPAAA